MANLTRSKVSFFHLAQVAMVSNRLECSVCRSISGVKMKKEYREIIEANLK